MTQNPLPILYSFRRCPYAMRARMAILKSGITVKLREVALRNKPAQLLEISSKATVPVLVLADGQVIDESLDIMYWALQQHDPETWLNPTSIDTAKRFIAENDSDFKTQLDLYKYAVRFPEHSPETYRKAGELFLKKLECGLQQHRFLCGEHISIADISMMPFVRQFAHVDKAWFDQSNYPLLQQWLAYFLTSDVFSDVMQKYSAWQSGDQPLLFPLSHV